VRTTLIQAGVLVVGLVGCSGDDGGSGSETQGSGALTSSGSSEGTTSEGSGGESESAGTTSAGSMSDGSTSAGTTSAGTTSEGTTSEGTTSAGTTSAGTTSEGTDSSGDPTTEGANTPPEITSEAPLKLVLDQALGGDFEPGLIFLASSVTKEIRVYDAETLAFKEKFTHPLFQETSFNPRGMAFNSKGNLVVASFTAFVEFSDVGVVVKTYPKKDNEATENVIFDALGNLYTTTATGGTDRLNQYAAADYSFVQTIKGPVGAGQYTGITFDDERRLYLASQSDNKIHVAQADEEFKNFEWVKAIPGTGPAVRLEGLVFNRNGELVVAQADMLRYDVNTGTLLGSFDVPQNAWPVPVRVDNIGRIYTADFENGNGSLPADIIRFQPDGTGPLAINDPALYGPFGLAISGTVLASDPPVLFSYQVEAVDADGDALTFSLVVAPGGMTIDAQSGLIEWLVTSKELGVHDVTVLVEDGQGGSDQQSFMLEISAG
jgi:hypothetical protein